MGTIDDTCAAKVDDTIVNAAMSDPQIATSDAANTSRDLGRAGWLEVRAVRRESWHTLPERSSEHTAVLGSDVSWVPGCQRRCQRKRRLWWTASVSQHSSSSGR